MKKIIFICLLTFSMLFSSGCQKSNIINSPISEFNLKTLSESNRMYRDDVPILTLLENNQDTIITVMFMYNDLSKCKFYHLDNQVGYKIIKEDDVLYLQNNEKCFKIHEDGSLTLEDHRNNYEIINPIESTDYKGFCFNRDCSIDEKDEAYATDPEVILPITGYFDYKDYEMVSFTRLCGYVF